MKEEVSIDAETLSRRVFGGYDDNINLKSGLAACSFEKLTIEKINEYHEIIDGVLDITLNISTSEHSQAHETFESGIMNPVLENAINDAIKERLNIPSDVTLNDKFDFLMICLPPGTIK